MFGPIISKVNNHGGPGSGSWSRWGTKTTTEEVHRVDIRYMHQQGFLRPGYSGMLTWSCGDRETGKIGYWVEADRLVLIYRANIGGEWAIAVDYLMAASRRGIWTECRGKRERSGND
jgi:hypothetical protein